VRGLFVFSGQRPIHSTRTWTFSRRRSERRGEARAVSGRKSIDLKGGEEAVGEGEEAGEESCQLSTSESTDRCIDALRFRTWCQ
jgi:hypothetical protein